MTKEINDLGLGLEFDSKKVCILLFADDIVILGDNEAQMQTLLNFIGEWCKKWKLKINKDKTKIVHFRNKRTKVTDKKFYIEGDEIELIERYKYLGIVLDQYLDYKTTAEVLSGAAGRALGGIIAKFNTFRNIGFKTFTKLFNSGVVPILEYCAGVWGDGKHECCEKIQQRAIRYYLGVHQKSPILAIEGDMGWFTCKNRRYVEMCRLDYGTDLLKWMKTD